MNGERVYVTTADRNAAGERALLLGWDHTKGHALLLFADGEIRRVLTGGFRVIVPADVKATLHGGIVAAQEMRDQIVGIAEGTKG